MPRSSENSVDKAEVSWSHFSAASRKAGSGWTSCASAARASAAPSFHWAVSYASSVWAGSAALSCFSRSMPARARAMSAWQASRNSFGPTVRPVEAPRGWGAATAAALMAHAAAKGNNENFKGRLLGCLVDGGGDCCRRRGSHFARFPEEGYNRGLRPKWRRDYPFINLLSPSPIGADVKRRSQLKRLRRKQRSNNMSLSTSMGLLGRKV